MTIEQKKQYVILREVTDAENGNTLNPCNIRRSTLLRIRNRDHAEYNNKVQPRSVVAGPFREDGVLITEGLQAGEKIAIAGVHTLVKDQLVKPVIEAAP